MTTARIDFVAAATPPANDAPAYPPEMDEGATPSERMTAAVKASMPQPRAVTPADVLAAWRAEGRIERVATGFPSLDEACRGGLGFGRRHYLVGAPGAGKTAIANVIVQRLVNLGLVAGILAIDEEPADLLVRWAQMVCGLSQADCERRDPDILTVAEEKLSGLRLRMYGPEWSIEGAAADLAAYAKTEGRRAVFTVDSLQTATCELERLSLLGGRPLSSLQSLDARVSAIRSVTTEHRFASLVVSEMNRGAYRSQDASENANDMAAAKGSGSVEYSAQLLLAVRSVKGHPDIVHVAITKNRAGQANKDLYLELDRARHELRETDAPVEEAKEATGNGRKLDELAAAVRLALLEKGPIAGVRGLRGVLRERGVSFRNDDLDAVFVRLGDGISKGGTISRPKWTLKGGGA